MEYPNPSPKLVIGLQFKKKTLKVVHITPFDPIFWLFVCELASPRLDWIMMTCICMNYCGDLNLLSTAVVRATHAQDAVWIKITLWMSLTICRKFCITDDGSDIWRIVWIWCIFIIERFEKFLASFLYVCILFPTYTFCIFSHVRYCL